MMPIVETFAMTSPIADYYDIITDTGEYFPNCRFIDGPYGKTYRTFDGIHGFNLVHPISVKHVEISAYQHDSPFPNLKYLNTYTSLETYTQLDAIMRKIFDMRFVYIKLKSGSVTVKFRRHWFSTKAQQCAESYFIEATANYLVPLGIRYNWMPMSFIETVFRKLILRQIV